MRIYVSLARFNILFAIDQMIFKISGLNSSLSSYEMALFIDFARGCVFIQLYSNCSHFYFWDACLLQFIFGMFVIAFCRTVPHTWHELRGGIDHL